MTLDNFERLFKDILNPKQLEGLRLLLTPFPQQQFNLTEDRRSAEGHPRASPASTATPTATPTRPRTRSATSGRNEHRHRIDTPSLRGVGIQRLFGSQRALKSVEDFTEFEQRAAYFDGDHDARDAQGREPAGARQPGALHGRVPEPARLPAGAEAERARQARPRARPAEAERRGEELFFGKAQCATCHVPPYYTDNLMHNLQMERFFKETMINGRKASADGPIKTFPLRGIKDSPPYLHDDRLLTLDDTVEFFNLVLGLKLVPRRRRTWWRSCERCRWLSSFDTSAIYSCSRALHKQNSVAVLLMRCANLRTRTVILCPAIDPVAAAAGVGQLLVGLADLLLAARARRCGRRACRFAQRLHGRFPL